MVEITDAVSSVTTILTADWNSANTDSITPNIDSIFNVKRVGGLTGYKSTVLCYEGRTTTNFSGIGWNHRNKFSPVSIDIRTSVSRAHFIKLIKEVDRIVNSNRKAPDTDYDFMVSQSYIDLSDKRKNLWRAVYDVQLEIISEVV